MDTLTEKDIHCMARILQGVIYEDSFDKGCEYCMYFNECWHEQYDKYLAEDLREHLQEITGLHLNALKVDPIERNYETWDSLTKQTAP